MLAPISNMVRREEAANFVPRGAGGGVFGGAPAAP